MFARSMPPNLQVRLILNHNETLGEGRVVPWGDNIVVVPALTIRNNTILHVEAISHNMVGLVNVSSSPDFLVHLRELQLDEPMALAEWEGSSMPVRFTADAHSLMLGFTAAADPMAFDLKVYDNSFWYKWSWGGCNVSIADEGEEHQRGTL